VETKPGKEGSACVLQRTEPSSKDYPKRTCSKYYCYWALYSK